MQIVVLFTITIAPFGAGIAAGRYAGRFGLVLPVSLTLVLGHGWEWSDEAIFLVLLVAFWSVAGVLVGLRLRSTKRGQLRETPS